MKLTMLQKKNLKGLLFIVPWVIGFVFFFMIPILKTLVYSFHDVRIGDSGVIMTASGFSNYTAAFLKDANFPVMLTSSFISLITDVPLILVFSFFVSVLLNQKYRNSAVFKVIFFLTVILSSGVFLGLQVSVSGINNQQLTNTLENSSSLNNMLSNFKIEKYMAELGVPQNIISYLIEPMNRVFSIINRSGIQIFIFLAGLKGISPALFEAAHIEGATGWEAFWKVTFPMISPLILVNIVYTIIDSFMRFGNGTLDYIYNKIFYEGQIGFAGALSWIYFAVVGVTLALVAYFVSRKVFYYE